MSWLAYLSLGATFVAAAAFGLLIPLLVAGSRQSPAFGAGVVGAMHLLDTWFVGAFALPLGLAVTPFDFAFVVLALALLLRADHLPTTDRVLRLWLGACLVWLLVFALGAVLHKTKAGVEYRQYFYLSVGVLYLMSFRLDAARSRRVLGVLATFALGTLAIALYRWSMELFAPGVHYWQEAPGQLNWRVINAQQTFVFVALLLVGLSALMAPERERPGYWLGLLPLFLAAVVALQHRTDWMVLVAAALVLLAAQRGRSGGRASAALLLLAGAGAVVAAGALGGGALGESLQQSVAEPFARKSTLAWRLDSWREVARAWWAGGPAVWPFGFPFGHGWRRFIESSGQAGLNWEVSPHSFYVTTLARGGIAGLALVLGTVMVALRRHLGALRAGTAGWPGPALMVALIAAQLVFFVSYSIVPLAVLLFGLALATAARSAPPGAAAPAPGPRTPQARPA